MLLGSCSGFVVICFGKAGCVAAVVVALEPDVVAPLVLVVVGADVAIAVKGLSVGTVPA